MLGHTASSLPIRRSTVALLLLLLTTGVGSSFDAFARFGGGGFDRGGYHFEGGGLDTGYRGSHPMYGDNVRPHWGSTDGSFDGNRVDHDTFNTNINVDKNFYNRPYNGFHPNWANGGYWHSRPWNTGWYHWAPDTWGWWGASAAAWGLAGLATGVAITELVNNASANQSTVIVVPQSDYQLNYGSVDAVGTQGASFNYTLSGGATLYGAANCRQGLLNGQPPQSAADAQLLNAVCQVAYGSAG
jgi:hypothetical protein